MLNLLVLKEIDQDISDFALGHVAFKSKDADVVNYEYQYYNCCQLLIFIRIKNYCHVRTQDEASHIVAYTTIHTHAVRKQVTVLTYTHVALAAPSAAYYDQV